MNWAAYMEIPPGLADDMARKGYFVIHTDPTGKHWAEIVQVAAMLAVPPAKVRDEVAKVRAKRKGDKCWRCERAPVLVPSHGHGR